MKRIRISEQATGEVKYVEIDLYRKLNLEFLRYTNLTQSEGSYDLSALSCNTMVYPDYIALSGQPSLYRKTSQTAVGFWEYDEKFDGIHGLYNAIYHNEKGLLEQYKRRYAGVRYFFTPDYSLFGDVSPIENNYRMLKGRVVGIWFATELNAVVIPFISAANEYELPLALTGLENCSVVAFSTKGYVNNLQERKVLERMVRVTVDELNLRAIVVYDVCATNDAVNEIFSYARESGVDIIVPLNSLKERNIAKWEMRHA